jgi:hypothetical protein
MAYGRTTRRTGTITGFGDNLAAGVQVQADGDHVIVLCAWDYPCPLTVTGRQRAPPESGLAEPLRRRSSCMRATR